ncbi:hypothetical protein NXX23_18660 [Bacteroides ovatus]|nr:hypothetical protein [Bacteroides ovatus]
MTYPVIVKGNVEMRSFTLSEISSSNYNYDNGILTITLANGSTVNLTLISLTDCHSLKNLRRS